MQIISWFSYLIVILWFGVQASRSEASPWDDRDLDKKVDRLYKNMLPKERAAQLIWVYTNSESNYFPKLIPAGFHIKNVGPVSLRRLSAVIREHEYYSSPLLSTSLHEIDSLTLFPMFGSLPISLDSTLLKDYRRHHQRMLDALGLDLDINTGINLGLSLHELRKDADNDEVVAKLLRYDGLLVDEDIEGWAGRLQDLLKSKQLGKSVIEKKVKKILRLKIKRNEIEKPDLSNFQSVDHNSITSRSLALKLYASSFQFVRNQSRLEFPIKEIRPLSYAFLSVGEDEQVSRSFQAYLRKYVPLYHFDYEQSNPDELRTKLGGFDRIFVILQDSNSERLDDILSLISDPQDLLVTYFGEDTLDLPEGLPWLWHKESRDLTSVLAPQIWFGGIRIDPHAPPVRLGYNDPELQGIDPRTLQKISEVVISSIEDNIFPGCQVLVAKDGKVVFERSYGNLTYDGDQGVTQYTLYDLASISKVLGTGTALMHLYESGEVDLEKKASSYVVDLKGTSKENVIIKDILLHQAGLYTYWPFWHQTMHNDKLMPELYHDFPTRSDSYLMAPGIYPVIALRDSILKWTISLPMIQREDEKSAYDYQYSDLGFYILFSLIEQQLNQPLDSFLIKNYFDPLGMQRTSFIPTCIAPLTEIAPTEEDSYFRNQLIHGTVHDPTAAMYGGIAGHAGIFSTASDLAKFMQMMVWGGQYGGVKYFEETTIHTFTSTHYKSNRRGLGWDKPDREGEGNTSRFASFDSFGHTGFTGTAVWADPQFDLIYVFLSNRIFPDVDNEKISDQNVRTRIHNLIYEAIWEYRKTNF